MAGLTERERELRTQRKELWEANVPLVEKVGRGEKLTVEERTAYDERDKQITELGRDLELVLSMRDSKNAANEGAGGEPDTRGAAGGDAGKDVEKRQWAAFQRYCVEGHAALSTEERSLLVPQLKGVPQAELGIGPETRVGPGNDAAPMQISPYAITPSGGGAGGYLVPPGFWHRLQIALKAYGGVYRLFEQMDTDTGQPLDWATHDPTSVVAQQLNENTQVTPQDLTFGFGQLNAWTFVAGPFLASIQLANDSAFDLDTFLRDRIAMAIGRAQAANAWSGSGSNAPLGLTTALIAKGAASVGTGGVLLESGTQNLYNFAHGGTATTEVIAGAMSFQTVFQLITMVDPAYRALGDCNWVMNDTTLQNMRTVTDAFNRPLIQTTVNVGGTELGDRLGGYPVVIDNNAPSINAGLATPTVANLSGPVFGRFSSAMVARNVRQTGVMRLTERYADFLAIAWMGYMRFDIRSNDMRAVATVSYHT